MSKSLSSPHHHHHPPPPSPRPPLVPLTVMRAGAGGSGTLRHNLRAETERTRKPNGRSSGAETFAFGFPSFNKTCGNPKAAARNPEAAARNQPQDSQNLAKHRQTMWSSDPGHCRFDQRWSIVVARPIVYIGMR